jgi:hypothetical protein
MDAKKTRKPPLLTGTLMSAKPGEVEASPLPPPKPRSLVARAFVFMFSQLR